MNKRNACIHALTMLVLLLGLVTTAHAQVQVTSAMPSSTVQGTTSLDVTVNGNGFDNSAAVKFLVTGTTDTGGITVRQVAYRSAKKLIATIDVADSALVTQFDIEVELSSGRKGKGTTLFSVLRKSNDACAGATSPAFAYTTRSGKYMTPQLFVADASGACKRFITGLTDGPGYITVPQYTTFRYKAPAANGQLTGRVAIADTNRGGVFLAQFNVDPAVPGMELLALEQFFLPVPRMSRYDLSPDGLRLAVLTFRYDSPTIGNYTYEVLVTDVDACIAAGGQCTFDTAYTLVVSTDGLGFDHMRWGSDGQIYVEKRTGKIINPSIVRIAGVPPYSTEYELMFQPSVPRFAMFDVQVTTDGDVLVVGDTDSNADYCYRLKTAQVTACTAGSCAFTSTGLITPYYTTAESVGPAISLLTLPISKRSCTPGTTIIRKQGSATGSTEEALVTQGEWPASAR